MEFHLMRPEWLWTLLPAALLAAALWRSRNTNGSWSSVIAPELLPFLVSGNSSGNRPSHWLPGLFLAWVLAAVAASGPSWQKIPQPIHQKQDALILVLDLSYSMKAGDLAPSRIDRARQKLLDLLETREEGQTGLIAYAGDAHIVTPLTDDTPTIANLLPALHPDMMPVPGSDALAAVSQAIDLLHSAGISEGRILLLTDGIDRRRQERLGELLQGSGMALSIMGIGTRSGAPIPLPRGGFLKDDNGAIVMPSLDENGLRRAADAAGGRYMRLQIDNGDLEYLLADFSLTASERTFALDRSADTWEDQGYFFILLLLPLTLALFRRGWLLGLLPLLLAGSPQPALAGPWEDLWLTRDQQAQRALQNNDNEAAAQLFEDPDWAGTAAYRNGDYETALQQFKHSDTADGWYNRGNALARAGQLDKAIEAYNESLRLAPDQQDALDNLATVERLLDQQQQQQQRQQQQQSQQQDNGQQQQQDSQDGQQNGDNEQQQDGQQQGQSQQQPGENPTENNSSQQQQSGDAGAAGDEEQQSTAEEQAAQEANEQQQAGSDADTDPQQTEAEQGLAQRQSTDPDELERQQAMEQWLRRVPDDPSGLLREKFRYESRQRQQQGQNKDDDIYW